MSGYFADKINAAAAGLTLEAVDELLRRKGVDEESAASVRRLLSECDAARFATGGSSVEHGEETAVRARDVLRSLERGYLR